MCVDTTFTCITCIPTHGVVSLFCAYSQSPIEQYQSIFFVNGLVLFIWLFGVPNVAIPKIPNFSLLSVDHK